MPYNMNFQRYPKAEHFDDVLSGAKESFDATGKPGNITIPVSGVNVTQQGPPIVTLLGGFENLDEIDQLQESVISKPGAESIELHPCAIMQTGLSRKFSAGPP